MTGKIFRSTLLVALAVLLVSLVTMGVILYRYFDGVQMEQLQDELTLAARGTEDGGEAYLAGLDSRRYRLTWVAADGTVLYDTQADAASMENHAQREEIRQALERGRGSSARYSDTLTEQTLYEARLLSDGTVLRISISRASVGALLVGLLKPAAVIGLLAAALSAVLARGVARRVVRPLNELDLDHPLDNDTYEELSPLLVRIDRQRSQIAEQLGDLRRRSDEFRQITDNLKEGLVLLDARGAVLSINPAAAALFGADRECLGKDFLTVNRRHDMTLALKSALEGGHSETRGEENGREYQFDFSPIESEGTVVGAVLLAFDVTEQAFAERNRREFTANVSHELKTPLQSIIGSAELLEAGLVKPEDAPRFVGRIREDAARLVALIEDIILLSRLDEGGEQPRKPVSLRQTAREAAGVLRTAAESRHVTLTVEGDEGVVEGVPGLLYEAVYNLCDNAVKYNREGGTVTVTVTEGEDEVALAVADTGIGIPPEHQSRVFERFYRVDKSHSRQSGGTGLGLSIVKHAVQYHGGRLELHSRPGEGTVITAVFPRG